MTIIIIRDKYFFTDVIMRSAATRKLFTYSASYEDTLLSLTMTK